MWAVEKSKDCKMKKQGKTRSKTSNPNNMVEKEKENPLLMQYPPELPRSGRKKIKNDF